MIEIRDRLGERMRYLIGYRPFPGQGRGIVTFFSLSLSYSPARHDVFAPPGIGGLSLSLFFISQPSFSLKKKERGRCVFVCMSDICTCRRYGADFLCVREGYLWGEERYLIPLLLDRGEIAIELI